MGATFDGVLGHLRADPVWRMRVYQLAIAAHQEAWHDASRLVRDPVGRDTAGQLYRAVGSIAANIAEGYSRSSGRDRARLFEYALGSAREAIVWCAGAAPVIGCAATETRIALLQQVVRLLLTALPRERTRPTIARPLG
jgi:four helix bundle protein